MLRTIGIVAALQLLAWAPAWACTSQVGTVIFQDTFADDSGGWDETPPQLVVKPPILAIALDAQVGGISAQNLTFNTTDGDFCMDFVLPPAISPNNQMYAGIEFWATDYSNAMLALVASNGTIMLQKEAGGNWTTVFNVPNVQGFNSAANAVNSLRVTAVNGTITVFINGTTVKTVRAQEPTNPHLNFGLYGEDDTSVANAPVIQIKGYSVTTGK